MEIKSNIVTMPQKRQPTLLDMRLYPERFPRLRNYKRDDAIFEMSKIVSQAFIYKGQKADDANINFIAAALVDELMEDDAHGALNISFAEISRVVKRAVLGGEEMYGISVASLYKVILDYVTGEGTRLQNEAAEIVMRQNLAKMKESPTNPMIQAYAGALVKNIKTQ